MSDAGKLLAELLDGAAAADITTLANELAVARHEATAQAAEIARLRQDIAAAEARGYARATADAARLVRAWGKDIGTVRDDCDVEDICDGIAEALERREHVGAAESGREG